MLGYSASERKRFVKSNRSHFIRTQYFSFTSWDLLEKVPDVSSLSCNSPDFLRGLVVKNLPVNAGDTGSISDPGRSHRPWSTKTIFWGYHFFGLLSKNISSPMVVSQRWESEPLRELPNTFLACSKILIQQIQDESQTYIFLKGSSGHCDANTLLRNLMVQWWFNH